MDLLSRLLQHDACMTRRLIDHARQLDPELLSAPMDIGPGSVAAALEHVVGAVEHWSAHLDGAEPGVPCDARSMDGLRADFDVAAARLADVAQRIQAEGRLDEKLSGIYGGTRYTYTRGTAIAHAITHGMHHRAQVINMLRRLGAPVAFEGDPIEWELETGVATAEPIA